MLYITSQSHVTIASHRQTRTQITGHSLGKIKIATTSRGNINVNKCMGRIASLVKNWYHRTILLWSHIPAALLIGLEPDGKHWMGRNREPELLTVGTNYRGSCQDHGGEWGTGGRGSMGELCSD